LPYRPSFHSRTVVGRGMGMVALAGQSDPTIREAARETDIERAKTQLKSELLLGLESMRYRTSRNAYSELYYGRQLTVEEICQDIDKVTSEELKNIANEFLRNDQLSLVVVGPTSELQSQYELAC
jgi:predicted Zn-dependent peptidase